jgi:serine/threonine-protein kinase
MYPDVIKFLRRRDYKFIKELGQGACGKTILIHDDIIDEYFVCKKYLPLTETINDELFQNFMREIKLLHQVYHNNIVRIFNYYPYPESNTGYIIMEYINGQDIESYTSKYPEQLNELFVQAIEGFGYLETHNILHRDIRPQNILIGEDATLKIIDLGFGKRIKIPEDFDKSVSLNWWCEPPLEFKTDTYNFKTEVYFLGKLFERIINDNNIKEFKYNDLLSKMCQYNPMTRLESFVDIDKILSGQKFTEIVFNKKELETYRTFSDLLANHFHKIDNNAKYIDEYDSIVKKLEDAHRKSMLEETLPNASSVTRCFVVGNYYYEKEGFPVYAVRDFLKLLKTSSPEKKRIIITNLHTKLDSIKRYNHVNLDDVPF